MVMTADPPTNNHSPHHRSHPPSTLPWAQIVRGAEPDPISAAPIAVTAEDGRVEGSDSNDGNAGRFKKGTAWNKQSLNGVVEEVSSVIMGGTVSSWPALSESTRPTSKSSSDSSSKSTSDKSDPVSQGPMILHTTQEQAKTNVRPNFTPNNTMHARPRSTKHRGGSGTRGGFAQSGFSRPLPPPPLPPPPPPYHVFGMPYGGMLPTVHGHSSQRNAYQGGNFGPRPHGDGVHHNGHGGRRNKEPERKGPRGSNITDLHMQPQMAPPPPRGFIRRSPHGSTPFIVPPPVRPFGSPISFDIAAPVYYVPPLPPDSFRGVPLVAHAPPLPPPMFFPAPDHLPPFLVNQIDYYFSEDNLVKDEFLRSNMDDQGWVPITLIATFPRVRHLTTDIQLILESLRDSTVVEVQGDKVRRQNEWGRWIPGSNRFPTDSISQSPGRSTDNVLAVSFEKVSLDEVTTTNQNRNSGVADNHAEVSSK